MGFRLHLASGHNDYDDDDATYTFNEAGLLVIHLPHGRRLTYAAGAWTVVEEPDEDGSYLPDRRPST